MYGAEETNLAGFRIASLAAVRICSFRGAGWCVRLMIDLGRLASWTIFGAKLATTHWSMTVMMGATSVLAAKAAAKSAVNRAGSAFVL